MALSRYFSVVLAILLLTLSGCGIMNALSDPPDESDTDVSIDDVGIDDVGHDAGAEDADIVEPDADASPPDDADPRSDADADTPDAETPDADVTPVCDDGDTEACDCDELPIENIEGTRECEDNQWGDCQCPQACNDPVKGPVLAGDECGVCSVGEYECNGDTAICDQPGPVNECGGCEDVEPGGGCSLPDEAFCTADETQACHPIKNVDLNLEGLSEYADFIGDISLHYTFVSGLSASEGCTDWERKAAATQSVPDVYRSPFTFDEDEEIVEIQLPSDAVSPGVLRVILRQPLFLEDLGETTHQSTHFACVSVDPSALSDGDAVSAELYVHPTIMHGDYALEYATDQWGVGQPDDQSADFEELLPGVLGVEWIRSAMQTFLATPGRLLTGCQGADCPHGEFLSLFDHYDDSIDGSALSGWNDFYAQWNDLDDHGIDDQAIIDAYQEAFLTHEQEQIDNLTNSYKSWRANLLDLESQFFEGTSFYLFDGSVDYRFHSPPATDDESPEPLRNWLTLAPFDEFCMGDNPHCMPIPEPVEGPAPTGQLSVQEFDAELSEIEFQATNINTLAWEDLMRRVYYEFLPNTLHPDVDSEDDGQLVSYFRRDWENLSQMLRTIAPCDEISAMIEDAPQTDAETAGEVFADLCRDIYGAPQQDSNALHLLDQITELVSPMAGQSYDSIRLSLRPEPCEPRFVSDPTQGFRLVGVDDLGTGPNCLAPYVETGFIGATLDLSSTGGGVIQLKFPDMSIELNAIEY